MKLRLVFGLIIAVALGLLGARDLGQALADPGPDLTPALVEKAIVPGGSVDIEKTVHTPEIPPDIDVCLLEDETGSFGDDIGNLQSGTTAQDIFTTITTTSPGAQFAVAGFRDYPVFPHGGANDHVYRLLSPMNPNLANWLTGIAALTASGGADFPEAQYDAIVAAAGPGTFNDPTLGLQNDCGWRVAAVTRVLVVATDAAFHLPGGGKPHVNTQATTVAALDNQGIAVVGLKAPGAGLELDNLVAALAAGGSVQPLSSDGANIGAAILAGLAAIQVDVAMATDCSAPISVTFAPASQTVTSGDDAVFTETISVAASAPPDTYECDDFALIDGQPMVDAAGNIIKEHKIIRVFRAVCVETVNPAGKNVPPAGSTTLPGPKGGQNEDGFYELLIEGPVPGAQIYVVDKGSDNIFGTADDTVYPAAPPAPGFPNGTKIKYTEANGITPPDIKPGPGAIDFRIKGQGDAVVFAVDAADNVSDPVDCKVPPPPKGPPHSP